MDVRLPDGTIIAGVPDGTTQADVMAFAKANGVDLTPKPQPTIADNVGAGVRDLVGGAVRGAGSIGATLLSPIDAAARFVNGGQPVNVGGYDIVGQDRRAGMDATLKDAGVDTNSKAFGVGKVGAEIAGTLGAGGGAVRALEAVAPEVAAAAPALMNAIRTGGMTTGTRAVGAVPQAIDVATRAAGGAINGGLSAALVDPKDAATGAAIGGALPVVAKVAGAAGQAIGSAVSPKIARANAVNKLAATVGDDAPQVIADIQTYYPKGAENIPVSAAAITKNPALAQLEQGSRLRSAPDWYNFDVNQGKAAYDNVLNATKDADQVGTLAKNRADNWTQAWQDASAAQKPRVWQSRMNQFFDNVDQAMVSPESSNPAVRNVLESVKGEMDRLGPNFGIGNLQQLRANLNGKVQPMSPDAFKSAPRDNPAIISIKQEMDDILNSVTGGKWQKVIDGYASDSADLHAAKAAQKVRNAYVDADTGRVVSPVINGDIPRVTAANLTNAMNAARLPDKSLALAPDASQQLEATIEALRRQGMVQELKRSATAGGGSDTISNAVASGAAQAAGAPNMLMQLLAGVRQLGTGKTDNAMAQLLSNPDELANALEGFRRPVTPNRLGAPLFRGAPVAGISGYRLASGQ
jgi:hypothetical protein